MYRIDTSQARTDLSGINKGAAQVLDLTPLREQAQLQEKERFAQQQEKAKIRAGRQDKINEQIGALGSVAINPRDRELFAQKQKSVRDYVIENSDALNNGDANAMMGFQNLYGNLMTEAEQSKNGREQWEQQGSKVDWSKMRPESREAFEDFMHPDHAGQYEFDPSIFKQNFDYADHLTKNLFPYAKSVAGANEKGYSSQFTQQQANQTIKDDVLSDPIKLDQATYDFNKAEDRLGAKDPVEYYQKKYAPKLVIQSTKPTPEWMNNGSLNKNDINVTHTVDNEGGVVHVMNKNNNDEVNVQYNEKGDIIGGTMTRRLSPEEKSQNDKIQSINIQNEQLYKKAIKKANDFKAQLTTDPEADPKTHQAEMAEWHQLMDDANAYNIHRPLPYREKEIPLDKDQVQEEAHDKFGIKAKDIISGKGQQNVDVQKIDNRKEEDPKIADWNAKWNALPKGQKLVGPDGKTYTKQ